MISIVIPVFNEEENIAALHEQLLAESEGFKDAFEVLFVNDGSTDQTEARVRDIAEKDERFKLISFSRNFTPSSTSVLMDSMVFSLPLI